MKIFHAIFFLLFTLIINAQALTISRQPTPILGGDWDKNQNRSNNSFARTSTVVGIPRIIDGDTVEVNQTKMRLSGIDAPETDQVCLDAKGQKWACGASAKRAGPGCLNSFPRKISGVLPGLM